MEVLISIAVVAVGLLGVASLIPIGSFAVTETAKSDRSAALGRAAMHDIRACNMLEPLNKDGNPLRYFAQSGQSTIGAFYLIGQAIAVDPLFAVNAAAQESTANYNTFPYTDFNWGIVVGDTDSRLARLRLDIFAPSPPTPPADYIGMVGYNPLDPQAIIVSQKQLAVFGRIFASQDDLVFDIDNDDPDRRPRQSYLWSDGKVAPYETPTGGPPYMYSSVFNGDYTWMFTAEPDANELPVGADLTELQNHKQKTYKVSVVTFYKRDMQCDYNEDPPSERFVNIQFAGTGIGGGDAVLAVNATSNPDDYLRVKENQWIMVTAFVSDPRLQPLAVAYNIPACRRIARWYKIIRLDDEIQGTGPFTRNVTLAGPDWDNSIIVPDSARATIIDGAIGVYTTTVTVE